MSLKQLVGQEPAFLEYEVQGYVRECVREDVHNTNYC